MKMWITLAIITVANIGLGYSLCGWSGSEWRCVQHVYGRVLPLILAYEAGIVLLAWSDAR